jgi:hypothetical protein
MGQFGITSMICETYNEDNFKRQPCAIRDKPFPRYAMQTNWIHKRGEKASHTAKELENRDALCALREWEEFNKESYLESAPESSGA